MAKGIARAAVEKGGIAALGARCGSAVSVCTFSAHALICFIVGVEDEKETHR